MSVRYVNGAYRDEADQPSRVGSFITTFALGVLTYFAVRWFLNKMSKQSPALASSPSAGEQIPPSPTDGSLPAEAKADISRFLANNSDTSVPINAEELRACLNKWRHLDSPAFRSKVKYYAAPKIWFSWPSERTEELQSLLASL
jgi:hypothetical protein